MLSNFILYLLYGLAFYTLGVAILSRDMRLSELGIARILWLLALFGITHGIHEWLELLQYLQPQIETEVFLFLRLLIVALSFVLLFYFGLLLNIITAYGDQALASVSWKTKILIGLAVLGVSMVAVYSDVGTGADLHIRWLVALPGGLLSGLGLVLYSRNIRAFSKNVARNFILAGFFMICYAVFTGAFPSHFLVPVIDLQVIMLRGLSAFFIMFFTIRGLSVFSLEQKELVNDRLQRFVQSEKLASMGVMAAGIAHEINNPLTNAGLNLEMLKDTISGRPEVDRKLTAIERNITRASSIAAGLLHFSRDSDVPMEPLDLNEVIASSVSLIQNRKRQTEIRLNLHDIPSVMGIPHRLEEVFINLLMNSLDACDDEDRIEIETSFEAGKVAVVITDTGHGIHPDNIPKVFDPFFTTKEIGKGTGLGLSVCYNIIKRHQGEVSLVSSEHGGAVVTLTFPIAAEHE